MPRASRPTCLVLAPTPQPPSHAALFEQLGRTLHFDVVRLPAEGNRAGAILDAAVVLADVSGNDPEVLYHLGVAHTFGKRAFLVTDSIERLPYDLASSRAWVVQPTGENRDILKAMKQFLSIPYAIGPVRIFLAKFAFFGENLILWRFLAFLIDAVWMLLLLGLVLHLVLPGDHATVAGRLAYFLQQLTEGPDTDVREMTSTVMVTAAYVALTYFVLSTWLIRGTFGQLMIGLRVAQTDYRRVTFGQSVGRSLLSVLVIMTYGAAFLSALRAPGYQAVHDMLSGTIVVRRRVY